MPSYGQFCPIAQASEVLTERWTPLVIRELALTGSRRFNDIQRGVPLMSSSLLSKRLRQLERAGIIERRKRSVGKGSEYHTSELQSRRDLVCRLLLEKQKKTKKKFKIEKKKQITKNQDNKKHNN